MSRRNLLWLILVLHLAALGPIAAEIISSNFVDSWIYDTIQSLRSNPASTAPDNWANVGHWLISWWFFVVLVTLFVTWIVAIILAATDETISSSARAIWCAVIFMAMVPAVAVYCIVKLLRPNNSFKPSPA